MSSFEPTSAYRQLSTGNSLPTAEFNRLINEVRADAITRAVRIWGANPDEWVGDTAGDFRNRLIDHAEMVRNAPITANVHVSLHNYSTSHAMSFTAVVPLPISVSTLNEVIDANRDLDGYELLYRKSGEPAYVII